MPPNGSIKRRHFSSKSGLVDCGAILCHGPLYFEDVNLERYGRTHGLAQPAVSAVHFGGRFAAWPYLMGAYPPHECIYTLGRQPPGTYSAYHWHRPPLSVRGAIYQAGVVTGLTYIVP